MSAVSDELTPDRIENCPHPRETQVLHGHESAEQSFLTAINAKKLHHAWLLEGPKGCGKASLAYRVARTLLGAQVDAANGLLGVAEADPVTRQITAGSYPDLMSITNGWNEKTKKWRNEISVDQVRKISGLFANRAAGNGWRVCIIDCADDLNHNAANALLKTLEEPPKQGLLLLVCHRPGRMLATIRSRCRRLVLRAPGEDISRQVAMASGADETSAKLAATLAQGCPGRAAQIANAGGLELWNWIEQVFANLPKLNKAEVHVMANRLAVKNARQSMLLFLALLQLRLQQEIHRLSLLGTADLLAPWLLVLEDNRSLQADIDRINLDPAMSLYQLIAAIAQAAIQSQNIERAGAV
ncbi:DNA polymerase III delta prime subunit [hydrothermal vent metagenome]|uniref:DNA polymerase III delta prime subunit n=1 Tax=hydrothermal vent metagenome TaxID=652676 RepID=A0A3B0R7L4_9ZZZZ